MYLVYFQVAHQFSHVHHLYHCWHVVLDCAGGDSATPSTASVGVATGSTELPAAGCGVGVRWVARDNLAESAVPASVKKVCCLMLLVDAMPCHVGICRL